MRLDRPALRVVAARLISRSGGEAAFFVGIWGKAAYRFDATAGELAVLMAALGVAGLAGSAIAGMLIDRHGPKKVLIGSELLFVPATIAAALAGDLAGLTAAAAAIGLIGGPAYTAIASLPPYLTTDPDRLGRINAAVETAGMAALITGTAIGAALAAAWSIDSIFFFDAATSVAGAALVLPLAIRAPARRADRSGGMSEIREGFGVVYRHRRLRFYVLAGTSLWLVFGLFSALEPLFYRDVLGRGPETIGWVNTIFGIGLVGGTLLVNRIPSALRGARLALGLLALNGLAAILYVGTRSMPVVVTGAVTWGVLIGMFAPVVRTMVHLNSPEEYLGRVMGTTQVHSEGAKLVPLLAAPALAVTLGVQATLAWSGLVLTGLAVAAWRTGLELDRTRGRPVPGFEAPVVGDEPLSPTP